MKTTAQHIQLLNESYRNLRAFHRKQRWAAWLTLTPILQPFAYRVLLMAQAKHEGEVTYTLKEKLARHEFLNNAVQTAEA